MSGRPHDLQQSPRRTLLQLGTAVAKNGQHEHNPFFVRGRTLEWSAPPPSYFFHHGRFNYFQSSTHPMHSLTEDGILLAGTVALRLACRPRGIRCGIPRITDFFHPRNGSLCEGKHSLATEYRVQVQPPKTCHQIPAA